MRKVTAKKTEHANLRGEVSGPFELGNNSAYRQWRAHKLLHYPSRLEDLIVRIKDPADLTSTERSALIARCRQANMVIYEIVSRKSVGKDQIRALGLQLGLRHLDSNLCADNDSITSLQIRTDGRRKGYIPYSNKRLSWHTDGYYNEPSHAIRSILMHCVQDAAKGGDNALFDHEIAYMLMRDENPEYIRAFMRADAMTIPANVEHGIELRPLQAGPVFRIEPRTGNLLMRYTARTRNIAWRQDAATQAALKFLQDLMANDSQFMFRYRLRPGQGIICNNVLHNRSAFIDDAVAGYRRLVYRARYYDRVVATDFNAGKVCK